jgi:hypothetical protein
MKAKPFIVLPVITGKKPYNQTRVLRGFIAMKVTDVRTAAGTLIVEGTLVKGLVKGTGGLLSNAGSADPNNVLSSLSPGVVKLVQ